jgi:hypothetical protein
MQLEYVMCDDWWIMAKDEAGQMYYISCSQLQKQNGII